MSKNKVVIIDYGMGNLWSVYSAFRYLGEEPKVSGNPSDLLESTMLVLPGVGSFRKAMEALKKNGLDQALLEAVKVKGIKILGICLGMQLFGTAGSEDGESEGLSLIPARVDRFSSKEHGNNKVPHVGFNSVKKNPQISLLNDLPNLTDFYFVHSYRMLPQDIESHVALCTYGIDFVAVYEKDNIFAAQFHPEKSQNNGLKLIKNFLAAKC